MLGTRTAIVLGGTLASAAIAGALIVLFAVFRDTTGTTLVVSSDETTLNASNEFFSPSAEGSQNGQACVTCHQPSNGITITVPFINQQFTATNGADPLFRPNDTANNPSTTSTDASAYSVFLALGTPRIGELVQQATTPNNFTIAAANAATDQNFAAPDMFPLTTDPQHPSLHTISVFRRPIVNVNVNFDSSVLWDGRASTANLRKQVNGAIVTLPLGTANANTLDDDIAAFMTGVYVAQKSDNAAGQLNSGGATGGPDALLALAQSPTRPCVFQDGGTLLTPFVAAVTGGSTVATSTCTPVVGGPGHSAFTLYKAWLSLSPTSAQNQARLSIARGEEIFNNFIDAAGGGCTSCHSVPNVGNHPSANFMIREGHDSATVLTNAELAAANAFCTAKGKTSCPEAQMIQDMIDRVNLLPLYQMTAPNAIVCSSTNTIAAGTTLDTTDPGRALVTGTMCDAGKQKPPVLRGLAVRAPFFHNGDAVDMAHLVNFYRFFLKGQFLDMSDQQVQDLINFLNAL